MAVPVSMVSTGSAASVRPASRVPTAASVRRLGWLGGQGCGAQPRPGVRVSRVQCGHSHSLPRSQPQFPYLSVPSQQCPFACPTPAPEAARLEDALQGSKGSAPQALPTLIQKQVGEDGAGAHGASGQWQCQAWLRGPMGQREAPAHPDVSPDPHGPLLLLWAVDQALHGSMAPAAC